MTTAKNEIFSGLWHEKKLFRRGNWSLVGRNKNLEEEVYWGDFLGLGVSKYLAGRRGTPPTPTSRENPANMCEV